MKYLTFFFSSWDISNFPHRKKNCPAHMLQHELYEDNAPTYLVLKVIGNMETLQE